MYPTASIQSNIYIPSQSPTVTHLNTLNIDEKSASYTVATYGHADSLNVAFPENHIALTQEPIDATHYEQQWRTLSADQQLAIRRWTAAPRDEGAFSDGSKNLRARNIADMNFEINAKLSTGEFLEPEEVSFVSSLSSALRTLQPCPGDYLRVDESPLRNFSPWGSMIRVGDTVTNFPRFMSASMTDEYARDKIGGDVIRDHTQTLIFYKLCRTYTSVPLLFNTASLTDELESLFDRDSCFRVTGYSQVKPVNPSEFPPLRIGVLLEQVPTTTIAKNIYTGVPTEIRQANR